MTVSTLNPLGKARRILTDCKVHQSKGAAILHPTPTSDPNDPLNWSTWRKTINFTLVSFYVLITFVQLDISFTAWQQLQDELGYTIDLLNAAAAVNYAGLAAGCIVLVPLVHKYGRRPLYLLSIALQLASCIWFARTYTTGDIIGANIVSGVGGAISETIVQITIADLFFVHHHAAMNGFYLLSTFIGAYLGPVAAGYVVNSQGWRWIWWWCVILLGVNLVLTLFFFEESKYISTVAGERVQPSATQPAASQIEEKEEEDNGKVETKDNAEAERTVSRPLDSSIKLNSYRQRLAWITPTPGSILHDFYQPVVLLFTFPAIAYTSITYGSLLAWFAILTSVQATYLFDPPYNFSSIGVGLMNIAPFVGSVPGFLVGGYLNDKSIIWLARRNNNIYEPEMRLWLALPAAIVTPGGLLMFGLGLAYVCSSPPFISSHLISSLISSHPD